jgi:hypothetical protein
MMRPVVVSKRNDSSVTSWSSKELLPVMTRKTLRPSSVVTLASSEVTRTMTFAWTSRPFLQS